MHRGSIIAPQCTVMHRAASPHGAGRTPTGNTPLSVSKTTISNRNFSRLEFPATHRKHSPDPKSNRNFRSTIPPGAWGRHFCPRNAAHTPMPSARTASSRSVIQAGVGLCAVAFAFPPLTSSRGPFTGRRISLRFESQPRRTLAAEPAVSQLIISNRSARRLEMPETYRKQTTAPLSNRHKFTHRQATSLPTSSFLSVARRPITAHPPLTPSPARPIIFSFATDKEDCVQSG